MSLLTGICIQLTTSSCKLVHVKLMFQNFQKELVYFTRVFQMYSLQNDVPLLCIIFCFVNFKNVLSVLGV